MAKSDAQASLSFFQKLAAKAESLDLGTVSTEAKVDRWVISPLKFVAPNLYNQATTSIQNQYASTTAAIQKAYSQEFGISPKPLTLYHYSVNEKWRGKVFPRGNYLTNNPNLTSEQARQELALPRVSPGQQLYLYKLSVNPNQVTPKRTVEPHPSRVTGEILPGGGVEYIAKEPIAMQQLQGVPVANE